MASFPNIWNIIVPQEVPPASGLHLEVPAVTGTQHGILTETQLGVPTITGMELRELGSTNMQPSVPAVAGLPLGVLAVPGMQPGVPAVTAFSVATGMSPGISSASGMQLGAQAVTGMQSRLPSADPEMQLGAQTVARRQPRLRSAATGMQLGVPAVTGTEPGVPVITETQSGIPATMGIHPVVAGMQPRVSATSPYYEDPIDTYASYLRRYYLRCDFPDYDKLPASPSKKYTRLASVLKEHVTKQKADEFTKETIQGNIDDIEKKKVAIKMEEIAPVKDGLFPKCILVEGSPGIGKTTFAWEMCRKWSKWAILQDYKLVVLLRLREKKVRDAKCVSDLFCYYNKEVQQQVVQMIKQTGGKGVLLLFDGYDELPANLRTRSAIFMDVIKGNELPEATVLVTSRPSASGFLYENCRQYIKQHIEILGFTSAEIQSYLKDTCGENESLLSGIQKYLQWYPHIRTMMYVPLNAGIVIEVYRTSKINSSVIPKTKTQLYRCLVCSLLRRYLNDHPVYGEKEWSITSFEDLPANVYKQFCALAIIAEKGIRNNQQVIFNDLPEGFDTLGLMQCIPELYVDRGAVVSYSFPHLTIQEFMAAFHISQGPVEKLQNRFNALSDLDYDKMAIGLTTARRVGMMQLSDSDERIIMQLSESGNERMVMRFVAGLTELKGVDVCHQDDDQEMIEPASLLNEAMIEQFHWIFEAQVGHPSRAGGAKKAWVMCKSSDTFDWYVLGYCIARSDRMWKIKCSHNDGKCLEGLVLGLLEHKTNQFHGGISALQVNYITVKVNCRALNKLLTSSSALERLCISGNDLSPETVELIFSGLQASTGVKGLKLSMSCSQFSQQNCKSLASLLQNNNGTLRELRLEYRKSIQQLLHDHLVGRPSTRFTLQIENEQISKELILAFLPHNSTTISGSVTKNRYNVCDYMYALGYCVSHTSYSWDIHLTGHDCKVEDAEAEKLLQGILDSNSQPKSTITSITIRQGEITAESVRQIQKIPKHMLSSLKSLALTDSHGPIIDVVGYTALNTLLGSLTSIETVDITSFYLSPEAAAVILNGLWKTNSLRGSKLFMTCSQFSMENCRLLASVLQNNDTLREIKIYLDNNINRSTKQSISLRILPSPLTAIHSSVKIYSDGGMNFFLQRGCTTLDYVLGYCVSHTDHTWAIDLHGFGDEEVKMYMQGVLECKAQRQPCISSLSLNNKKLTAMGVNQLLNLPKHTYSIPLLKLVADQCTPLIKGFKENLVELHLGESHKVIDMEDYQTLGELLASPSTLEILNINSSLPREAVDLALTGLQQNTGLKEFSMRCEVFSPENCKSLASVVQRTSNSGTLRRLQVVLWSKTNDFFELNVDQTMELQFFPDSATGVCGSVTSVILLGEVTTTLQYALGYCVSHTACTWEITIKSSTDEEVESFVSGVLDCENKPKSTIISLTLLGEEGRITSGDSKLTSDSVKYIISKHMLSSLETLSLTNNPKISNGGCASLVEKLPATLVHLDLSNTGIGVEDCKSLSKLLASSSALETLDIGRNHLPPVALELIFSGLQKATALKTLTINYSQLSPKAYELLSSLLTLTLLSINSCSIRFSEIGRLVDALMCQDTLQCLKMADNPIGDKGADHLCRYMKHSKSLRTLDISVNTFSLKSAENLTSILHHGHNTTLETLILPDRFSCWIPESLRNRVTTEEIETQKSLRHKSSV